MSPRTTKKLLAVNLLLCLALGSAWWHARIRHAASLTKIASAETAATRASDTTSKLRHSIATTAAALTEKQRSWDTTRAPEIARHALALQAIERLKQQHAQTPPPPRLKLPPLAQRDLVFAELMSDPEYRQLSFQAVRDFYRARNGASFRSMGLAPAISDRLIDLLTDKHMVRLDYQQLLGSDLYLGSGVYKGGKGMDALNADLEKIDNDIRALLTPSQFSRLTELENNVGALSARRRLSPLITRLSYSDFPLSSRNIEQLSELLAQLVQPASTSVSASNPNIVQTRIALLPATTSDLFIEAASPLLLPDQAAALKALQAEQHAKEKRGKLPKSSEIPRL